MLQRIVRIKALIVFFAISALIWLAGGSWGTEPVSTTLALPFPTNLTTKKTKEPEPRTLRFFIT